MEPPRGMYPARLDDKGRLKLPEKFQRYLEGLEEKKLFVTSTDRLMATVYPIAIWRENEALFASFKREKPGVAKRVWFTVQELGSETQMDGQGRVQFSPELRRALGIENQAVKVLVVNGAIQVMSEETYHGQQVAAAQSPENDAEEMQRAGMK